MNDLKLQEILKSFSAWEFRRLGDYVQSPYLNTNKQLISFHQLICKQYPHFLSESFDKKNLFKNLFPKERYEDKKMRYLFTDYTRILEKFLVDESLDRDASLQQQLLRKELAARNCSKSYRTKVKNVEHAETEDADYFLQKYQTEYTHLDLWISKQKRKQEQNIEAVIENLDRFYLAKKLELSCAVQNLHNVLAVDYNNPFQKEVLGLLKEHEYGQVPIIAIYHQVLLTLTKENEERHFQKLLDLLLQHERKISLRQLREIYQSAMNYCIKKINKGNSGYFKTLFEIYKVILPKKILMRGGFLPQFDYKNIVTISLRMKELAWARTFIEEYKPALRKEDRENAYLYNLAHWHFHNREYSKALSLFQRVKFTDIYYQLDTRSILLKTYFEQDDLETFLYHASAFRTYIRRNKLVSEYQRTSYRNFIRFAGQLLRASGNEKKISAIKNEMEKRKHVADMNWLLQKTE
jgi:hypothetical protein